MDDNKPLVLLLDVRNDKHYFGFSVVEAVIHTGRVSLDFNARTAVIDGKNDTVSFSDDYSHREFVREAYARAMKVLCRDHGFILFTSKA